MCLVKTLTPALLCLCAQELSVFVVYNNVVVHSIVAEWPFRACLSSSIYDHSL